MGVAAEEEHARKKFDHQVAGRNLLFAVATFSAEHQPAQNGHVVIERDLFAAVRTGGTRRDHRLAKGQPVNAHVQETAEGESQSEDRGCKKRVQV